VRIIYFVEQFLSPSETFILNQVNWFNKKHQVSVLCTHQKENHFNDIEIKVIPFQRSLKSRISNKFLYITKSHKSFAKNVNEYIEEENPDLIHCHFGIQALTLLDNLKSDLSVFITFHGYDTKKYLEGSVRYVSRWQRLFKKPNIHPIFVCQFHKDMFQNHGVKSDNAVVLYNGVYPDLFKRTLYPQVNSFVQLSRLTEKKGHYYTIKAFEKYSDLHPSSKFHLTIIGDGELKEDVKTQIEQSKIKDNIVLISWLKGQELIDEIQKHKFYVQHSITSEQGDIEATSISILEAMAMEMPILSTLHAGIPETVDNGKHGILTEEKNVEDMASAIEQIISWDYLKSNRMHVQNNFDLEKRNHTLEALYNARFS